MKLQPDAKSISEIFPIDINVRFNIPNYQRHYSWKDENIETLINDIFEEEAGYYLGNLIVTDTGDDKNHFDVVDGQQRLTTLALIFLAISNISRDFLEIQENNSYQTSAKGALYNLIVDIKRKLFSDPDQKTPQLSLLSQDQEIYKSLLNRYIKEESEAKEYKNRILGKRYLTVKDQIMKKITQNSESIEKYENMTAQEVEMAVDHLQKFYNKVNNAEILRIIVSNLNDAFTVFTSFNAKGLPLTLIDLLKPE